MLTIPRRPSLIAETRAVLLEGIRAGRWVKTLPGERLLAAELQVSRATVAAAMAELKREGRLAVHHGRRGEILPAALEGGDPHATRAATVALLVPQPLAQLRQFTALWVDELRRTLHDLDIGLRIVDSRVARSERPARSLQRIVATLPDATWLLLLTSRQVQAWFQSQRVPAIVTGTCGEGIVLPSVDADHRAAGVHAGHVLLRMKHRRIAYFVPPNPTGGVLHFEAGMRATFAAERRLQAEIAVMMAATRDEVGRAVERCCTGFRPTAIVCAKAGAALSVWSHLAGRGLRVPRDISLLSTESEPFFDLLAPPLSHYALDPARFARLVARRVVQPLPGGLVPDSQKLELRFVAGGSVAPPPT
jgi:DNA-binding LacI/PurR family transcriptional regulator